MSEMTHTPADVRERVEEAWATVEAAALAQANALDSHYGGQRAKAAEIRNAVEQVASLLRTPRGEGEAREEPVYMTCMGCGQEFDPDDDTQSRYHEAACEVVDYEPARVEIARRLRDAALRSEAQGEDGRDSVWVASAGVFYESGDAVDAFATEDEAVAWLKAQIDEWLRERLQWVEDEEEIEEIRANAPEIEFGDRAHVVEAISGEWWKVQRYDLRAARRGEAPGEEV